MIYNAINCSNCVTEQNMRNRNNTSLIINSNFKSPSLPDNTGNRKIIDMSHMSKYGEDKDSSSETRARVHDTRYKSVSVAVVMKFIVRT